MHQHQQNNFEIEAIRILTICFNRLTSAKQVLEDDKIELFQEYMAKFSKGFLNFQSLDHIMQNNGIDLVNIQKAKNLLEEINKLHSETQLILKSQIYATGEKLKASNKHSRGLKGYNHSLQSDRFRKAI